MPIVKRVVLVMIEGLAPDAVRFLSLYHLGRLRERGSSATIGLTTTSSRVGSRLSLMTGVSAPGRGLITDRPPFSSILSHVDPLGTCISGDGFQVSGFLPQLPLELEESTRKLGRQLGFQHLSFKGTNASETVRVALNALCTQRRGLIAIHLDDISRKGDVASWMSPAYAEAAQKVDQSVGLLTTLSGASAGDTLLVVVGNRYGDAVGHALQPQSELSVTLFGKCIAAGHLDDIALTDVSATILWALGITVPRNYEGRVLSEAFQSEALQSQVFQEPVRERAFA